MGESLQAPVTLGIFILDIFVNINRRPEWLRSATSSMESINISKIDQSNVSRSSNRNLTSWRKTRFLNGQQELKGSDSKEALKSQYVATLSWVEAVSQCHIRSETSGYYPQTESCGRSDASFDGIIECYSGPMVMYPLTK
ncbi:hypothetical protein GGI07_002965 [Coemansia sp. Benny D115]|nr:hypothetical protein GGI07_002965 [Coemansia sp. Benny D115]